MKKFRGQEGMRHTYHRKQNFTSDTVSRTDLFALTFYYS